MTKQYVPIEETRCGECENLDIGCPWTWNRSGITHPNIHGTFRPKHFAELCSQFKQKVKE